MNFFELIEKRYSVRSYRPDPVEEEKLGMILEAARLAPTAANRRQKEGVEPGLRQGLLYRGAAGNLRLFRPGTGLDEKRRRQVLRGGGCHHCHGSPDSGGNRAGTGNLLDCSL